MTNKIFIWVLTLFLFPALANAFSINDLVVYYNFDNSSHDGITMQDLLNDFDSNISKTLTTNVSGYIKDGFLWDGAGDSLNITKVYQPNSEYVTINVWVKNSTFFTGGNIFIYSLRDSDGSDTFQFRIVNPNTIQLVYYEGSNLYCSISSAMPSSASVNWTMITAIAGTTCNLSVNGVNVGTDGTGRSIVNFDVIGTGQHNIGSELGSSSYLGYIDEFSVWNKELSQSEISSIYSLYNSGKTFFYPIITINNIINNSNYSLSNIGSLSFVNFTYLFPTNGNCTLFINNVANSTNQSVSNGSGKILYINGSLLTGYYNASVQCTTAYESGTSQNVSFYVDSSFPSCNFPNSILVENNNYTFNVTCNDEHFFSINITCYNNNWTHSITGLNVLQYNLTNNTLFNESDVCSYRYCDGHTANSIKNWDVLTAKNRLEFLRNAKPMLVLNTSDANARVEYSVRRDRVKFRINFSKAENDEISLFVTFPSNKLYYLKDDKYEAWVVDEVNSLWFDLNNAQGVKNIKVKKVNDSSFEFVFRLGKQKSIDFDSVGELNCVNGFFNVIIEKDYVFTTGICPSELSDVMLMLGLLGFGVCLMFLGIAWQARFFGVFGCLLLMVLSWSLAACSLGGGLVFGCFAVVGILWFSLKA